MAENNHHETHRWYCHTCESETEPLLAVSMLECRVNVAREAAGILPCYS